MKNSLIRDHIVFGVTDNHGRERLLRVPDLEIARAAEATQEFYQLKQMQNPQEVNAVGKKKESLLRKEFEEKKSVSGDLQQVDCKFCGRRHVRDKTKCSAFGHGDAQSASQHSATICECEALRLA